jgi:hypothetical protein
MTVRRVTGPGPHPFSPVPRTDDVADRLQCATCGTWDWPVAPQENPHALWRHDHTEVTLRKEAT